jgi:hypothetical protein
MNAAAASAASPATSHGTRVLERSRLKLRIASSLSASSPSSSNALSKLGAEGIRRDIGVRFPARLGAGAGTTAKPFAFNARST